MKSAVVVTYELDDAILAASELADAIKQKLEFRKHSIGILLCDADVDGAAVTGRLKELLGFEVAGMTSLATLDTSGYHEAAAVLTVMTADDCLFTAAASAPLIGDGFEKEISVAYYKTIPNSKEFGDKPKLEFLFCPCDMPYTGDIYVEILSKEIPGVPLIGGAASDDYQYNQGRPLLSGEAPENSLVIVSIWGNIKPVFAIRHVTSPFAERVRRITDAEGNLVKKVGDETFVDYLKGFGFETQVADVLLSFNANPMMMTLNDADEDESAIMRHIVELDHETGAGYFAGDVPVGALGNICLLKKDDIKTSVRESMSILLEEASKVNDAEYSLVYCVSCTGRALVLGQDSSAEGDILSKMLPDEVSLMGSYCYGEIAPTRFKDGDVTNRYHNCSIALCMI
jgi:hypothetical protein